MLLVSCRVFSAAQNIQNIGIGRLALQPSNEEMESVPSCSMAVIFFK